MTIYRASENWIPQARKTVRKFASGLQITEQEFLFPGTPIATPKNEGDAFEGGFVFPQPSISTTDSSLSSCIVKSYGIWATVSEKIDSKILKTGTATTTQGTTQTTQEFQYLAARIQTKIAWPTNDMATPVPPDPSLLDGANSDYFLPITLPTGSGFALQKSWVLSQYEVQNYGQTSEVTYTYEVQAQYSRTIT
jgi:hypothetical protein